MEREVRCWGKMGNPVLLKPRRELVIDSIAARWPPERVNQWPITRRSLVLHALQPSAFSGPNRSPSRAYPPARTSYSPLLLCSYAPMLRYLRANTGHAIG